MNTVTSCYIALHFQTNFEHLIFFSECTYDIDLIIVWLLDINYYLSKNNLIINFMIKYIFIYKLNYLVK
jgi:hypothetical protein